jgi:hypothetical protein
MRFALAVALALIVVGGAAASASVYAVTPSAEQAKRATRLEVLTRYTILDSHMSHHAVVLRVGCNRLRQRLYRCSFSGQTATDLYEYVVSGKSMVRFDKHAHAKLYGVSCSTYNISNYITFDFGCLGAE